MALQAILCFSEVGVVPDPGVSTVSDVTPLEILLRHRWNAWVSGETLIEYECQAVRTRPAIRCVSLFNTKSLKSFFCLKQMAWQLQVHHSSLYP